MAIFNSYVSLPEGICSDGVCYCKWHHSKFAGITQLNMVILQFATFVYQSAVKLACLEEESSHPILVVPIQFVLVLILMYLSKKTSGQKRQGSKIQDNCHWNYLEITPKCLKLERNLDDEISYCIAIINSRLNTISATFGIFSILRTLHHFAT